MDGSRFDLLVQTLSLATSRRQTVLAFTGSMLGSTGSWHATLAGPGCKNVGQKCQKVKDCCSGICKGKKNKRKCKPHDTGGCAAGDVGPLCGGEFAFCETSAQLPGVCRTTTGNAGYCEYIGTTMVCKKDADCRATHGPQAACVKCPSAPSGTRCVRPNPG